MANIISVCDSLATHISGASYGISLDECSRVNLPIEDKKELVGNEVYVVPISTSWDMETRDSVGTTTYDVDIYVRARVSSDSNSGIDPLMEFNENMVSDLRKYSFDGFRLVNADQPSVFDRDKMIDDGNFFSQVTLSMRGC